MGVNPWDAGDQAQRANAVGNPALFPLVLLGFGLVAIGVFGVPLTGLLLQRREVREWMNSRA